MCVIKARETDVHLRPRLNGPRRNALKLIKLNPNKKGKYLLKIKIKKIDPSGERLIPAVTIQISTMKHHLSFSPIVSLALTVISITCTNR